MRLFSPYVRDRLQFALTLASIVVLSLPAQADPLVDRVVEILRADAELSGYSWAYENVAREGDTVVLHGITMRPQQAGPGAPDAKMTTELIRLENAQATLDGGLKASRFVGRGYRVEVTAPHAQGPMSVSISIDEIGGSDLVTPSAQIRKQQLLAGYMFGQKMTDFHLSNMSFQFGSTFSMTLPHLSGRADWNDDGSIKSYQAQSEPIVFPAPAVGSTGDALLASVGKKEFSLSFSLNANVDHDTRSISVAPLEYSLDDLASLKLTVEIGNVDTVAPANYRDIQVPQGKIDYGAALREKMMNWEFRSASIRLSSQKLVDPLFAAAARSAASDLYDRDPVRAIEITKQGVLAALPGQLEKLEHPKLADATASALEQFFNDPEKYDLVISFKPESTVTFATLVGTAMLGPKTLLFLLNADVTAACRAC